MAETNSGTVGVVNSSGAAGGSGGIGSINPFSAVGAAADALTNFLPQASEMSGDAGGVAAGLQGAWDGISDVAMAIPPVGTMVGGIMKAANFVGRGLNALGAGTDGMSVQDAILGSPFFNLTPFGLINGIFGKKADTFTKDNEVFAQMSSAYGGSDSQADLAARKSGKKYGLFSLGAMADANRQIREADRQQDAIRDIQDDMNNQNLLAASMSQINNQAYMNRLQGGYQQGLIRSAKKGSILENKDAISRAKAFFKNGSKFSTWPKNITKDKKFISFLETCPKEIQEYTEDSEYLYDLWRTGGKPDTLQEANDSVIPFFTINNETGKLVINENLKLYNELMNDDSFTVNVSSEESTPNDQENAELQSFRDGGQLNVIPEGALHAHKHNLEEIDENLKGNITHKGIPVVSVDEDGNVEQQAEVERNELILNLETTEAIEELRKEWHDEESPSKKDKLAEEAGRIFAKSVIENTDDRTNLMETV